MSRQTTVSQGAHPVTDCMLWTLCLTPSCSANELQGQHEIAVHLQLIQFVLLMLWGVLM